MSSNLTASAKSMMKALDLGRQKMLPESADALERPTYPTYTGRRAVRWRVVTCQNVVAGKCADKSAVEGVDKENNLREGQHVFALTWPG